MTQAPDWERAMLLLNVIEACGRHGPNHDALRGHAVKELTALEAEMKKAADAEAAQAELDKTIAKAHEGDPKKEHHWYDLGVKSADPAPPEPKPVLKPTVPERRL